jgi:hypothetical protein
MTKLKLFALSLSLCVTSLISATEKMTLEKAKASDRLTYPTFTKSLQQSTNDWNAYVRPPEFSESETGGKLEEVWKGSSTLVSNVWGPGDFYIEMTFNKANTAGSVWLTVDNSNLKKNAAVPSPFNYEGNWHIMYESGRFKAEGLGRGSTTPTITRISKFPTPMLNECSPGVVESQTLYCSSGQTCEDGRKQKTCGTHGGWGNWIQTRAPMCVSSNQQCP